MSFVKYTKPFVPLVATVQPRLWIVKGRFSANAAFRRSVGMAEKHPSTFDIHVDPERFLIAISLGETYIASMLSHGSHCNLPALRQVALESARTIIPGFMLPQKKTEVKIGPCAEINGAFQFDFRGIIGELNAKAPDQVAPEVGGGHCYICDQCRKQFASVFEAAPDAVVEGMAEQVSIPEAKPATPPKKPLGRPKNVASEPPPAPKVQTTDEAPPADPNRCILDHLGELTSVERQRFNLGIRQLWAGRAEEAADTIGVSTQRLNVFRKENSIRIDPIMRSSGTSDVGMLLNIWHTDAEKALSAKKGA